ncbi:MAG: DnaD domain protein [Oscillospiraceae bacterium]|nr:DnaD domain protein [Oscillospiraceae bacterium]
MLYRINTELYLKNDNIVLPLSVADECLKAANSNQIKVILWLFSSSSGSDEFMADELGLSREAVSDALDYWIGKGVVFEGSAKGNANASPALKADTHAPIAENTEAVMPPVPETAGKKKVETITVNPPTQTELVRRCKESQEIRELMATTEERINSTLSFSMQSTLLMLHDDYGLPVEVIALAVEYAAGRNKANARYIANIGRLWCENEIDTIDKAMEYIDRANSCEKSWSEFCDLTGVKNPSPTKKQRDFLNSWINTMGFSMDMIALAYEEMAERTDKFSFSYMNKVLLNWQKSGIFTPADAQKAKQSRFEKSKASKSGDPVKAGQSKESNASYDIEAYTKKAFSNPLNILK